MSTDSADALDLDALRVLYAAAKPGGLERHNYEGDLFVSSTSRGLVATVELTDSEGGIHDADLIVAAVNALPALIAEVERLTQQRDSAREWTTHLEQQNAEALRLVNDTLDRAPGFGEWVFMDYLRDIQRILGAFPDDETEQQ